MKVEKLVTTIIPVEIYCRPMCWAVVVTDKNNPKNDYVMAQFHSHTDAEFFVKQLPSQGLEVRKVVES